MRDIAWGFWKGHLFGVVGMLDGAVELASGNLPAAGRLAAEIGV